MDREEVQAREHWLRSELERACYGVAIALENWGRFDGSEHWNDVQTMVKQHRKEIINNRR